MSKEFYESKVAKDAARRFRMLCEYTFNLTEDDGEEDIMPQGGENADNLQSPEGGMPEMPDMNQAPEGDMPDASGMEQDTQGGAPGFNPQENTDNSQAPEDGMPEMSDMGTEPMQPDDEVIDVDELTNAQEETEEKVEDIHVTMEKGFEKLVNIVSRLDKIIDANTLNMEKIKQEIEKRNPTPMEKLNMRAANDSYPFNIKPDDYWREKEATSNYRIGGEDEPDAAQYTITQGDLDNITDFKKISQDLSDSEFNQNLMNIFGLK